MIWLCHHGHKSSGVVDFNAEAQWENCCENTDECLAEQFSLVLQGARSDTGQNMEELPLTPVTMFIFVTNVHRVRWVLLQYVTLFPAPYSPQYQYLETVTERVYKMGPT